MLQVNKSDRRETIEKHFHLKVFDAMNNTDRNLTINITNQISVNLLSSVSLK